MKALITALALVTLISAPSFAQRGDFGQHYEAEPGIVIVTTIARDSEGLPDTLIVRRILFRAGFDER